MSHCGRAPVIECVVYCYMFTGRLCMCVCVDMCSEELCKLLLSYYQLIHKTGKLFFFFCLTLHFYLKSFCYLPQKNIWIQDIYNNYILVWGIQRMIQSVFIKLYTFLFLIKYTEWYGVLVYTEWYIYGMQYTSMSLIIIYGA